MGKALGIRRARKVSGGTLKRDNLKLNFNSEGDKKSIDLDQYILIPIFLILLMFATTDARATEALTAAPTSQIKMEEALPSGDTKKFSLLLAVGHDSNLSARSNPDRDESTYMIINPSYQISEKSHIEARIDLTQNYDSERKTNATNTSVVFVPTAIDISSELKFKPEVSVTLPTDEFARDDESYQGSMSLRPSLNYTPSQIKGLVLLNRVYITKNFHEFEIKSNFSPNTEYSIRNRFAVSYAITEKLSIESVNDFTKGWSYNGYSKDSFYFSQSLGYEFIKEWNFSLNHKNEGAARGPNNRGENVELFATKSSYVGLEVSHVF